MQDSIYYYKYGQFKHFIQRIDDESMCVSDALGTFREVKCLSNEFKRITVQQLTGKPNLIIELSKSLRKGMKPESRFKLPYRREEREQELINNISENYPIDRNKSKAKVITGHYKNENTGQEFNYSLEVVIAPRTGIGAENAGQVEFIGNINSSPSIDGGERYFEGTQEEYVWKNKQGGRVTARNVRDILQECGFSTSHYINISKKKVPSVIYINLNTPCPEWLGSAGKTHIDLRPYSKDIAKTVSALAYKMPSYHGKGCGTTLKESFSHEEDTAKKYLQFFLRKRYEAVLKDSSLKNRDRLTQSGVWYRIRPVMIKSGFTPRKDWGTTRTTVQSSINKVCAELFGKDVKREDLGIIAAARATMLYNGQAYPVAIDNIEDLAKKGVAIVVIEKEGIANVLAEYAREYGVALVHTQGRFTEYGKDLIEMSSSPVGIITDYDAYGMQIAEGTRSETPRIGIDTDTITWLQKNGYPDLKQEDVEEEYSPDIWTGDEYLKQYRIELDSIAAKVGAEGLWKYIMYKLQLQASEGFDYNNVITRPESEIFSPETVSNLLSKLSKYLDGILQNERQKIQKELTGIKELISIKDKKRDNRLRLEKVVAKDEVMQEKLVPLVEKLSEELSRCLE